MSKKIVKLAVIRDNDSNPCPFGLPIPSACKTVGSSIEKMAPLEILGAEATEEEKEKLIESNKKAYTWSIMTSTVEPGPCTYAGMIFPGKEKVECNFDDVAPGVSQKHALVGSPFYSRHFQGIGLDGLYSVPTGWYQDFGLSRNLFYGIYSLQGFNNHEYMKVLANFTVKKAMDDKTEQ